MADLTAAARRAIPSSEYGLPGKRAYPVEDRSHAANAKARASEQYNAGRLSGSEKAEIDRKADAKLGQPRDHSLAMASADHLHRMGHISASQHQQIRSKAQAQLQASKQSNPAPRAFGAIG